MMKRHSIESLSQSNECKSPPNRRMGAKLFDDRVK